MYKFARFAKNATAQIEKSSSSLQFFAARVPTGRGDGGGRLIEVVVEPRRGGDDLGGPSRLVSSHRMPAVSRLRLYSGRRTLTQCEMARPPAVHPAMYTMYIVRVCVYIMYQINQSTFVEPIVFPVVLVMQRSRVL